MNSKKYLLGLCASATVLGGCELLQMAQATVVVSGLVVATPELRHAGYFDVDSKTVASAWVGERDGPTSTREPKAVLDASVTVTMNGHAITLPADAETEGLYQIDSEDDPSLSFATGMEYVFDAQFADMHGGSATAPQPLQASDLVMEPKPTTHPLLPGMLLHEKDTALKIDWPKTSGRYSYVSVYRADPENPEDPELVFDTRPDDSADAIRMFGDDPPEKVLIAAEHFAEDGLYAVVLVAGDKGKPRVNTFLGSPFLVGSGAAVLMAVGSFGQ